MKVLSKKGIAIPYIIALILGIIVIGVVAYWLIITPPPKERSECEAKKSIWCNSWMAVGFIGTTPPIGAWDSYAPGCTALGVPAATKYDCRVLTDTILRKDATCSENDDCLSRNCKKPTYCVKGTDRKTVACKTDAECVTAYGEGYTCGEEATGKCT